MHYKHNLGWVKAFFTFFSDRCMASPEAYIVRGIGLISYRVEMGDGGHSGCSTL